jgi:hypothetical protein
MDRTHVRFYTFETAIELLATAGLSIRPALLYAAPTAGSLIRRADHPMNGPRAVRPLIPVQRLSGRLVDMSRSPQAVS